MASRLLLHDCTPVTLLQHQQQQVCTSTTTDAGLLIATRGCMLVILTPAALLCRVALGMLGAWQPIKAAAVADRKWRGISMAQ
jgi:hypothetical protein